MSRVIATGRLKELDALRGIAAVMVLLFHYTWQSAYAYPAAVPVSHGLSWGGYGVQLFFAISGFVILMTLERTTGAADFVVSRFARLFPAYWAGVALTSAGVILLGADRLGQPGPVIAANLSMLQGFLYLPAVDGVYWSLTVELAFYACMLALWRLRLLDRIELVLIGWIALDLIWWLHPALPSRLGLLLVTRYIPWFAVGMASYRVFVGARSWQQQLPVLAAGFAAIAIVEPAFDLAVYAAVVAVFAALVAGRLSMLDRPVLIWLGALSYPIYLIHQNLGYALIARLEGLKLPPELALALTVGAALALAQAIRTLVERPALALIRGWWRQRKTPQPA